MDKHRMNDQELDQLLQIRAEPQPNPTLARQISAGAARIERTPTASTQTTGWWEALREMLGTLQLSPRPAAMALSLTLLIGFALGYTNESEFQLDVDDEESITLSSFMDEEGVW